MSRHLNSQGIEPCECSHARRLPYSPLILVFASSCICLLRQLGHIRKEGGRLADEKPHIRQEL